MLLFSEISQLVGFLIIVVTCLLAIIIDLKNIFTINFKDQHNKLVSKRQRFMSFLNMIALATALMCTQLENHFEYLGITIIFYGITILSVYSITQYMKINKEFIRY